MATTPLGDRTRRYETVLLDFDHTLFDSAVSERDAFLGAMSAMGIADPGSYFDTYKSVNMSLWKAAERGELTVVDVGDQRFFRFVETVGLDLDPVELRSGFESGMAEFGELYDGAAELLDTLAGQVSLGLVTNALSHIQRARIERVGIGHYFQSIVISSELGIAKPDPGIFDVAFDQLGLSADRPGAKAATIMIGDSLSSDIQGGANFGVDTCWFNPSAGPPRSDRPGQATPTHEAASFADVVAIIGL